MCVCVREREAGVYCGGSRWCTNERARAREREKDRESVHVYLYVYLYVCVCEREGCTAAVVVGALEDNVEVAEPLAHLALHVVLVSREFRCNFHHLFSRSYPGLM